MRTDRALLPEGRLTGPMPWVIAIMMCLTILAAAAGLGLGRAAAGLDSGNRITVQIIEAGAAARDAQAARALAALRGHSGITGATRVPQEEVTRLLEPWLGAGGVAGDIPIPALIEAELRPDARIDAIRAAVIAAAPSARLDDNSQWLAPLGKLIGALRWLAAGLVLLMIAATAATVALAARAALDTHRPTIEILHLMGATDGQVARLFQRRIALDALFGGVLGLAAAVALLLAIGRRVAALGSELVGSTQLSPLAWVLLALLPLLGVALAMLVARIAILRALVRLS